MENFLFLADSYKVSHHLQYPPGTQTVFSYFESRGGKWKETLFFGLQYILKKHLAGAVVTQAMVEEADNFYKEHFGADIFNRAGWEHIVSEHGGRLPLEVRAVPEGTVVPTGNVLFTVENTDPKVPWLTNFVETVLVQAWYPMTVATNSYQQKLMLEAALRRTADSTEKLPYMLHDFGYRGASSVESAGIGGAAHLVNFLGSDTLAGMVLARDYYSADGVAGRSIPATEHSTMTAWGRQGELGAVRHLLLQVGEAATVSVVADSYDVYAMVRDVIGGELRGLVEGRSGTLVVRPDSGDPATVLVEVLNLLGESFGHTVNSAGFKLLPRCVRVIQGDGVSHDSLPGLLAAVEAAGWSMDNVVFGSGGGLLQKLDRDTQRCAFKCSLMVRDGVEQDVYKEPVTDLGKKSKRGRLALVKQDGEFSTVRREELTEGQEDLLVTVFRDGELVQEWSWGEVRAGQEGR